MTALTKTDPADLSSLNNDKVVESFNYLKSLFLREPLLRHFDFEKDRVVHVDSSGYAIAAVLSQMNEDGKFIPVSYYSRKLTDCE
jgi:hypothetical protein